MNFASSLHLSNINAGDIRELKAQASGLWDWEDSAPAQGGKRGTNLWASLARAPGCRGCPKTSILLIFGCLEVRPGRWEALTQGFGLELSLSNTQNQPGLGVPVGRWMGSRAESPSDGKSPPNLLPGAS